MEVDVNVSDDDTYMRGYPQRQTTKKSIHILKKENINMSNRNLGLQEQPVLDPMFHMLLALTVFQHEVEEC